jgi:hypothetical protein
MQDSGISYSLLVNGLKGVKSVFIYHGLDKYKIRLSANSNNE